VSPRIALASAIGVTAADGSASVRVTGSLLDGETTSVQACAQTGVCASERVVGVAAGDLRVIVSSGDGQSVAVNGILRRVSFRVVDLMGHAVSGAAVTVYQAVVGWQPPCAVGGRCAPAPLYGTSKDTAMSDDDGNVLITPLQFAHTAAVTEITVAAGTQGEATATLQKTPN
jgi:hypothetical protein